MLAKFFRLLKLWCETCCWCNACCCKITTASITAAVASAAATVGGPPGARVPCVTRDCNDGDIHLA